MFDDFDIQIQSDELTPDDYYERAIIDDYDIDNRYYLDDYYRDFG